MKTITARNANDAFLTGIGLIQLYGKEVNSRNGKTLEIPEAASIMYQKPCERVLFCPVRDSNPFLGFFEALWIIAGRNDVKFLSDIVPNMKNYSDDGHRFYGAYGRRMRVGAPGVATGAKIERDQINEAIKRLKANPDDRQVVIVIRDPLDMWYSGKDTPCNLMVDCKVRENKLNIQVFNRSNDFVWGMLGTNVVQFSSLQEYMAAMIGCEVGHYHQTTSSMHVYLNDQWTHIVQTGGFLADPYVNGEVSPYPMMLIAEREDWHRDLYNFFEMYDAGLYPSSSSFTTPYFRDVVQPMWATLKLWKIYQTNRNMQTFIDVCNAKNNIKATDWKLNVAQWLTRREYK